MTFHILEGDARRLLPTLPSASSHCCVTSPPYFGLRDYGVAGQLGLEDSPEELVANLVGAFREVRRILRPDGTLWVVVGDSYAGRNSTPGAGGFRHRARDLIGFPWQLALALRHDGWRLRSEVVWAKPNALPESVTDRPSKSHEQLFLLARQARYFYDADALRTRVPRQTGEDLQHDLRMGGNERSVWTIPTQPFAGAHFATFPEALVERCLRAGTSAAGCCRGCGAPWLRVVERRAPDDAWRRACGAAPDGGSSSRATKDYGGAGVQDPSAVKARILAGLSARATLGWVPSCTCPERQPGPCTVLDPFAGSGTTGLVALRLGHRFVGVELNPAFVALARKRIGGDMPLFNRWVDSPFPAGEDS